MMRSPCPRMESCFPVLGMCLAFLGSFHFPRGPQQAINVCKACLGSLVLFTFRRGGCKMQSGSWKPAPSAWFISRRPTTISQFLFKPILRGQNMQSFFFKPIPRGQTICSHLCSSPSQGAKNAVIFFQAHPKGAKHMQSSLFKPIPRGKNGHLFSSPSQGGKPYAVIFFQAHPKGQKWSSFFKPIPRGQTICGHLFSSPYPLSRLVAICGDVLVGDFETYKPGCPSCDWNSELQTARFFADGTALIHCGIRDEGKKFRYRLGGVQGNMRELQLEPENAPRDEASTKLFHLWCCFFCWLSSFCLFFCWLSSFCLFFFVGFHRFTCEPSNSLSFLQGLSRGVR